MTDFSTWDRAALEEWAQGAEHAHISDRQRMAEQDKTIASLRQDLRAALDAYRNEVSKCAA